MATRMQQRRGTASQWTSSNPVLNIGEIGFESDNNKFKIGDGTNHWADLPYFLDEDTIGTSLNGYLEDSLLGANNGIAQLNSSGKLVSTQIPNVDEITQDAINTALVAGTGLDKTYDDNGNTITLDIDSTVATLTGTQTLTNKTLTSPAINTPTGITKTDIGLANVDNTTDANKPVSTATQTALDLKLASATAATTYAPLASPALTGTPTAPTAASGTNTTQVATTAFVGTAVADLVASAPSTLNTLNELATALGNDAAFSTTLTNSIALKAPLASPTFTGSVDFTGATVTGISSYNAPTLGSTSIGSGATVTTVAGLTLTAPTLTGTVTASGDINLSAANGPGSLLDELALILMGAL
jgi:hypothetical protein